MTNEDKDIPLRDVRLSLARNQRFARYTRREYRKAGIPERHRNLTAAEYLDHDDDGLVDLVQGEIKAKLKAKGIKEAGQ